MPSHIHTKATHKIHQYTPKKNLAKRRNEIVQVVINLTAFIFLFDSYEIISSFSLIKNFPSLSLTRAFKSSKHDMFVIFVVLDYYFFSSVVDVFSPQPFFSLHIAGK